MNEFLDQSLPNRIPVSIITGFLGSGKTTLLNYLVRQPSMESVALIINEFGEIGLDNLLVETSIENTLLLENGCICCSVRGDLIDTVSDLFSKARIGAIPDFSRILIETTGIADPRPIINTLQNEPIIAERCYIDSVVTLIDGIQGKTQIYGHPEAMEQIAQADVGLITKGDLVNAKNISDLETFILSINPVMRVKAIKNGEVPPDFLFGKNNVNLISKISKRTMDALSHENQSRYHNGINNSHEDISTWSFVDETPLNQDRLYAWLRLIYSLRSSHILRLKGLVRLQGEGYPLLLQGVGSVLNPPHFLSGWPMAQEESRIVFILKGLTSQALSASFIRHIIS